MICPKPGEVIFSLGLVETNTDFLFPYTLLIISSFFCFCFYLMLVQWSKF